MAFNKHRTMFKLFVIVYGDKDCACTETVDPDKVAEHVVHSASFFPDCAYDHTKYFMWSHLGEGSLYTG